MEKKQYSELVSKTSPKTKKLSTMTWAFAVGGLICCIGEAIKDALDAITGMRLSQEQLASYQICILIALGIIFTGFGLYDRLGLKAGAGSIVPITGFANAIASSAIEHKQEGVFFGICAHIFTIAGPVIVFGIVLAFVAGIIKLVLNMF